MHVMGKTFHFQIHGEARAVRPLGARLPFDFHTRHISLCLDSSMGGIDRLDTCRATCRSMEQPPADPGCVGTGLWLVFKKMGSLKELDTRSLQEWFEL
jgi:hypothetical protein